MIDPSSTTAANTMPRTPARPACALLLGALFSLAWLGGCAPRPAEELAPAPLASNLLLITIDTLRADHLGFHGYPRDTSPFLDRLAGESVVFDDAAVQVPKTLPSTVSILTSLYPAWSGVETNRHVLPDEALTLAEVLQDAGFATAAWTTNGNLVEENGLAQGFDRFAFLPPPADAATLTDQALADPIFETPEAGATTAGRDRRRRFTWLHYIDPHGPYTPPGPDADRFVRDAYYDGSIGVQLRLDEARRINWNQGLGGVPHYQRLPYLEHPRRRQRDFYVARYDAEIRYLDGQLERLLATLEERGLLADTAVVLTADHGEGLGEHELFFEHGWFVYQDQVHVPWLIRLPGTPAPRRIETPVELVDLAPTVLDLLGIDIPDTFQGRDLRPVLDGGEAPRRPLYSITPDSYPQRYAGVRLGPWKLIRTIDKAHHRSVSEHLYQLEEDPAEMVDRAEGEPEVLAGLRRILDAGPWNRPEGATAPGATPETLDPQILDPETLDPEVRESLRSLGYL